MEWNFDLTYIWLIIMILQHHNKGSQQNNQNSSPLCFLNGGYQSFKLDQCWMDDGMVSYLCDTVWKKKKDIIYTQLYGFSWAMQ